MEEIWKSHPNIDERYEFSNHGNFRNIKTNQILKNSVDSNQGYIISFLLVRNTKIRKRFRIHRLVAELFISNPNPEKFKLVNHIDGIKTNNHYSNLEWIDNLNNIQHAIDNNLRKYSQCQKLTIQQVILIREEYDMSDITIADLARKVEVTPMTLSLLLRYKTFSRIQPEKKLDYKINNLSAVELINWRKTKIS